MKLDRRGFVLTSLKWGSATMLLPACDLFAPEEPADGTFARPFTREDPGQWAQEIEIHQPVVYASYVDGKRVRLWLEVRDVNQDLNHEMTADHYIEQLVLMDEFGNTIDNRGFRYDAQARLVATVEIPHAVRRVYSYAHCNLHGWWRKAYDIGTLKAEPQGDARRAFTKYRPGQYAEQAPRHVPIVGKRPNGLLSVEVGDRAAGQLHPQEQNHYIKYILVYDQYDQLRDAAVLGPNNLEPVYDFPPVGGTNRLRVLVYCNTYNWWEAEYSLV